MSFFTNSQPIVIPDPADPSYGPSGYNVPIVSQSPGSPVTQTLTAGQALKFYTVAANLFPQATGGVNTYRFTLNAYISIPGVLGNNATGNVQIYVIKRATDNSVRYMGGASQYVVNGLGSGTLSYFPTVTCVFVPNPGDTLEIWVQNFCAVQLTSLPIVPIIGSGIELVSTETVQQLIFS